MIILHFTGQGHGFLNGVTEIIYLYACEDDVPDDISELGAPGFRLNRKYDTDTDTDFSSLPLDTPLLRKL